MDVAHASSIIRAGGAATEPSVGTLPSTTRSADRLVGRMHRSAWGESFNCPHGWPHPDSERPIDSIRIHISRAGGLTPCRKIAILGEFHGVKTAWHGPGDVSPIGHMCNLHLDLASYNFGVQEGGVIRGVEAEIFKGCETFKDGYLYANDSPGWAIEVDEKLAAKYPFRAGRGGGANLNGGWGVIRRLDGTVIKQ